MVYLSGFGVRIRARVMVFNFTFNNISVISSWSVWRTPEYAEKTTDLSQVIDKLYHIVLSRVSLVIAGFELTTLELIGNDFISSFYPATIRPRRSPFSNKIDRHKLCD